MAAAFPAAPLTMRARGPALATRRRDGATQAHDKYVLKCLLSPDVKYLATMSADHTAKLWDTSDFELSRTLVGHQRWVWDGVFSADSAYLVTASSDQTARLWDLDRGETIRHYTGHHKAVVCVTLNDSAPDSVER
jgi:G protein beta subunit-like protein